MLLHLLAMAGSAGDGGVGTGLPAGGAPTITAATIATLDPGVCDYHAGSPTTDASVRTSWSIANADDSNYETRIYADGVLVATVASSTTHWDTTQPGAVEDGRFNGFQKTWQFRIDVVRKVDGGAVSSQLTSAYLVTYGYCSE